MKTLKIYSKKANAFIKAYWASDMYTLDEAYKSHSTAKENAYNYCRSLCQKEAGYDFRIISANTFQFTCGWRTYNALRIETANNSYIINGVTINWPF